MEKLLMNVDQQAETKRNQKFGQFHRQSVCFIPQQFTNECDVWFINKWHHKF